MASRRAVVIELVDQGAVVCTDDGEFKTVRTFGPINVGDVIKLRPMPKMPIARIGMAVAFVCVILFLSYVPQIVIPLRTVFAVVSVEVNPGMELYTDRYGLVLESKVTDDVALDPRRFQGVRVDQAITSFVRELVEQGLVDKTQPEVVITVRPIADITDPEEQQVFERIVEQALKGAGQAGGDSSLTR